MTDRNRGPAEISLDGVRAALIARGYAAVVEQTGGGTATLYASSEWAYDESGATATPVRRNHASDNAEGFYDIVLGPGWFEGHGYTDAWATTHDLYLGPDGEDEGYLAYPERMSASIAPMTSEAAVIDMVERMLQSVGAAREAGAVATVDAATSLAAAFRSVCEMSL